MNIVVCGGRNFTDRAALFGHLDEVIKKCGQSRVSIIAGGCRGADLLARDYARERKLCYIEYPANWAKHGKSAGYIRNKEMADIGDILVAMPGGAGTEMMIGLAKTAGMKIYKQERTLDMTMKDIKAATSERGEAVTKSSNCERGL